MNVFDIGFDAQQIIICCDKPESYLFSTKCYFHARTKHIDVQYHFVHDIVENGKVVTLENVADELIMSTKKFRWCVGSMGLGAYPVIQ